MGNLQAALSKYKKEYLTDIGKILVEKYGKQDFYKPEQVVEAHKGSRWADGADWSQMAMCIFSSRNDFDEYQQKYGRIYEEITSDSVGRTAGDKLADALSNVEIPDIDTDASWLDLGGVVEGVSDYIGGVFEGLSG
jgi:hypothetical protein